MKRLILFPLLLLLSGLLQAAPALKDITIGYVRVMDDAQVLLAKEAGFFEKQGLNAKLVEFSSGTDLIKAIISGQLDYGVLGFTNAFTWASRGADLKVIAGAQRGYHSLLVRDDSGIKSVADLKGHTLASQKEGSTADVVLKGVVLKNAGVDPASVKIMGVKPAIAVQSLVAGHVDAAFLFEPYDRIAQLKAPVKQIYEIGKVWPFPCMVVITSGDTLKKHQDVLWAALDAQRQAIELLKNKPDEAAKLISHYFIADASVETLKQGKLPRDQVVADAIKTQVFSAKLSAQDVIRMYEIQKIMEQRDILKPGSLDVSKVLDLSWQQQRGLD